jgi:hypothetical protein
MEATEHLKKIVKELFEAKKFFENKNAELTDEFNDVDQDDEDADEKSSKLQEDIESTDEIVETFDDLILKIKESFDIEEEEIED